MTSKRSIERRLDNLGGSENLPKISLCQLLGYDEVEYLSGGHARLHGCLYRIPHVFYDMLSPDEVDSE